jgi:hypothetical protein
MMITRIMLLHPMSMSKKMIMIGVNGIISFACGRGPTSCVRAYIFALDTVTGKDMFS